MNQELLERAREVCPNVPLLVNMVSLRVKELNSGERPLVKPSSPDEDKEDIALREIAERAIIAEYDIEAIKKEGIDPEEVGIDQ